MTTVAQITRQRYSKFKLRVLVEHHCNRFPHPGFIRHFSENFRENRHKNMFRQVLQRVSSSSTVTLRYASSEIPEKMVRLNSPVPCHRPALGQLQQVTPPGKKIGKMRIMPPSSEDLPEVIERRIAPGTLKEEQLIYDQVTHTGQSWDDEDYRLQRFDEGPKQVNPNIAMHLIAKVAPISVEGRIACCDGGGGALGHPKVYINLDKPGNHICGYCGLRFYQDGHEHDGSNNISV